MPCPRPDIFRSRLGSAKDGKAAMDEPYFMDAPKWVNFLRENKINCFNVIRQSNFEIYPHYGIWEDSVNAWLSELWLPPFNVVTGTKDFQSYPTPHACPPYTLDSVASLIADFDIQDFLTGFWGIVESGENDEKPTIEITFNSSIVADKIVLKENIATGQQIESFEVFADSGNGYEKICSSTIIGAKRICRFKKQKINKIKIVITSYRVKATLNKVELYCRK